MGNRREWWESVVSIQARKLLGWPGASTLCTLLKHFTLSSLNTFNPFMYALTTP
jgi:hypothetical protein